MVIAIDGTSASGKSTVASLIAERLGFVNLNSGNLYRALAQAAIASGVDPGSEESAVAFSQVQDLELLPNDRISLNGLEIDTASLRSPRLDMAASAISFFIPVREKVNSALRVFSKGADAVCEGRDITSVVFPDAELKFFFDANVKERARRRAESHGGNLAKSLEEILKRDEADYSKPYGALRLMGDAVFVDTTRKSAEEVCAFVESCAAALSRRP